MLWVLPVLEYEDKEQVGGVGRQIRGLVLHQRPSAASTLHCPPTFRHVGPPPSDAVPHRLTYMCRLDPAAGQHHLTADAPSRQMCKGGG
jgi:hypothetical protein